MPRGPVPEKIQEILRRPNPCVIATVALDGSLHTAATSYEWTDRATVLVNMDASRRRLEHIRRDPRVAMTIFDGDRWSSHVSLSGHVADIRPDPELRDIDRIASNYTGQPYHHRDRDSWSAEIVVDRWHSWDSSTDTPISA